jgi:hypothetical protein
VCVSSLASLWSCGSPSQWLIVLGIGVVIVLRVLASLHHGRDELVGQEVDFHPLVPFFGRGVVLVPWHRGLRYRALPGLSATELTGFVGAFRYKSIA